MELIPLLQHHGFSSYIESLQGEGILSNLNEIKDSGLKDIGMTIGERIKFKRVVNYYFRINNRIGMIEKYFREKFPSHRPGPISYEQSRPCILIGHRGACGYEPENTLRSFAQAIDMGCDGIELDVHVCKSGELVVLHDTTLERTTTGKGLVTEKTLEELKQYDAGKGEKIPTLAEVLDLLEDRLAINIELKGYGTLEPTVSLLEEYFKSGKLSPANVILTSFIHEYIKEARILLPIVKTGLLIRSELLGFSALSEAADADYLVTFYEYANENVISDAHSRGIKVMTYTVNDMEEIRRLKKLGIDGIITNYPDRFFVE